MSNTVRFTIKADYLDDGTIIRTKPSKVYDVTTTSDIVADNVQIVGTSHAAITVGAATDDCIALIENLHATAKVSVGADSGGSFVEWFSIPAGYPPALVPQVGALSSTYLDSDTASTPVRVTLYKMS